MDTPLAGCAGVIGARVAVRAIGREATTAVPRLAVLARGTWVVIVASPALIDGNQRTLSGGSITRRGQAGSMGIGRGGRADHQGFEVDNTLVGKGRRVTDKGTVAAVAILQVQAIGIGLALAIHRSPHTLATVAAVGHGADIAIVAYRVVILETAAAETVTAIRSARVGIVTFDGAPQADSPLAMVPDGARIAIFAFAAIEGIDLAPGFARAGIRRALVAVVTQRNVDPFDQTRLVHLSITVVIHAVAAFSGGDPRITLGEPGLRAGPLSSAHPKVISVVAGCPEPQCGRFGGTGTDPCVGHTLLD